MKIDTKIVISSYDDIHNPHYGGGGAIAVHEVARRLAQKAFDVTVLTGKFNGSKNLLIDNVNYKRIGIDVLFAPQLSQLIYSLILPFYVVNLHYDIWIESFTPPFSTNFLQIFTQKPVVGLVHMLAGEDMKRKYLLPFNLIENIGIKTYKYFIVSTNIFKNKIKLINKHAQINVISNGIDRVRGNSGKARYALFLGRLELNQKGLDLLIQSWQYVKGSLIIAGKGNDYKKIVKMIGNLKLANKITLVGFAAGIKREQLLRDAAFVVVPSRFETFSMSALEAFSYGLPIVCYDIEGLRWTPKNAVIKTLAFDNRSYAAGCNKLFNENEMRKRMGISAKNYARQHTWRLAGEKFRITVEKILKHNISSHDS